MDAQEQPTAIAVAVVRQAGSVLIGLRPEGKPLAGYWEFPGGKIGSGESPGEAAVRECYEETGLRIHVSRSMAVVDHRYEHEAVRLHFVEALSMEAESRPRLPFRWVPIAELDKYQFPPANAGVLQALKVGRICQHCCHCERNVEIARIGVCGLKGTGQNLQKLQCGGNDHLFPTDLVAVWKT